MPKEATVQPTLLVYCTMPKDSAPALATAVVTEGFAACVNLIPGIRSIYRWQGELCDDEETLAIAKTTADRVDALTRRLVELHPYDCPEVIAVDVRQGHEPYLQWVHAMTHPA